MLRVAAELQPVVSGSGEGVLMQAKSQMPTRARGRCRGANKHDSSNILLSRPATEASIHL